MFKRFSISALGVCLVALILSATAEAAYSAPSSSTFNSTDPFRYYCRIDNVEFGGVKNNTSSQAQSAPRWHDYTSTHVGEALLDGQSFSVDVTLRGTSYWWPYYYKHLNIWVDWNQDNYFSSTESVGATYNFITNTFSIDVTPPASAKPGETGLRIRSWAHNSSYLSTYYSHNAYSYHYLYTGRRADCEDYSIKLIPPVNISDDLEVGDVWEGGAIAQGQVTATDGAPPYTYSIVDVQNASWVTVDAATGILGGVAPVNGAMEVRFKVEVEGSAGTKDQTSEVVFDVLAASAVPYSNDFDGATLGYLVRGGVQAAPQLLGGVGESGSNGFITASNVNSGWSVLSATADSVDAWTGQTATPRTGLIEFFFQAASATSGRLNFDYSILNSYHSGAPNAANLGVFISEDSGYTWRAVAGSGADEALENQTGGYYRTPTSGFVPEQIDFTMSGNQDRVGVRIVGLVRNTSDQTRVAVDNVDFSIPVEITTSSISSMQQEVPATPVELIAVGGVPPYVFTGATTPGLELPSGLEIVEDNGSYFLQGVPDTVPANESLTKTFEIVVTDDDGSSTARQYSVTFLPGPSPLSIHSSPQLNKTATDVYTEWTLTAVGGLEPYTWSFANPENVPAWLSIDAGTGVLYGTPDSEATSISVDLMVMDSEGRLSYRDMASQTVLIELVGKIQIDPTVLSSAGTVSLPSAEASGTYYMEIPFIGGVEPYGFSIQEGALGDQLPQGIGLITEGNTMILHGAPLDESAGTYLFNIVVDDSIAYQPGNENYVPGENSAGSQAITFNMRLVVAQSSATTFSVTSTAEDLPTQVTQGGTSTTALSVSGGRPPYSFEATGAGLPDFVSLTPTGLLTVDASFDEVAGVSNAEPGTYRIAIEVFDVAASRTEFSFDITVDEFYATPEISNSEALPSARVGEPYNLSFGIIGGEAPFNWTLIAGTDVDADGVYLGGGLPTGLGFNIATGRVEGILASSATIQDYTFSIRIMDSGDRFSEKTFTLPVVDSEMPALAVETTELADAIVNARYGATLKAIGGLTDGLGGYTWSYVPGSNELPEGLFLTETGIITGTPSFMPATNPTVVVVRVMDQAGATADQSLTIFVKETATDGSVNGPSSANGVAGTLEGRGGGGGGCSVTSGTNGLALLLLLSFVLGAALLRRRQEV